MVSLFVSLLTQPEKGPLKRSRHPYIIGILQDQDTRGTPEKRRQLTLISLLRKETQPVIFFHNASFRPSAQALQRGLHLPDEARPCLPLEELEALRRLSGGVAEAQLDRTVLWIRATPWWFGLGGLGIWS